MDPDQYTKGQEDLISHIKSEVSKLLETKEMDNIMFDVIDLLQNLKPTKELFCHSYKTSQENTSE